MNILDEQVVIWRFIDTGSCSGRENMAIDEALFRCFNTATSQPVLRLYGWQPPALSLGRFQKVGDDLDLTCCRADDLSIVRRITGGGAIYHADELTYSLVCSSSQIPPVTSVKDSFRVLTSFLLAFYRELGQSANYAVDLEPNLSSLGQRTPLCFAGKESYDILLNGRKIGGNAQRRSRQVIFQHGSIPLKDATGKALSYMKQLPEALSATSLESEGIELDEGLLKEMLKKQFNLALGVVLKPVGLTSEEKLLYQELLMNKYSSEKWNLEGDEA
jgi:lipoate-protein ligase A